MWLSLCKHPPECRDAVEKRENTPSHQIKVEHLLAATVWKKISTNYRTYGVDSVVGQTRDSESAADIEKLCLLEDSQIWRKARGIWTCVAGT